ncbi:hypothetical protein D3C81_1320680 [compost metagenome]
MLPTQTIIAQFRLPATISARCSVRRPNIAAHTVSFGCNLTQAFIRNVTAPRGQHKGDQLTSLSRVFGNRELVCLSTVVGQRKASRQVACALKGSTCHNNGTTGHFCQQSIPIIPDIAFSGLGHEAQM